MHSSAIMSAVTEGTDRVQCFGPWPAGTLIRSVDFIPWWSSDVDAISFLVGLALLNEEIGTTDIAGFNGGKNLARGSLIGGVTPFFPIIVRLPIASSNTQGQQFHVPLNIELNQYRILAVAAAIIGNGAQGDLSVQVDVLPGVGKSWRA